MKRRDLLLALLPLLAQGAHGQPNLPRVGVLTPWREPSPQIATHGALEAGLAEAGWIDGRTVQIMWRHGGGERERLETTAPDCWASRWNCCVLRCPSCSVLP